MSDYSSLLSELMQPPIPVRNPTRWERLVFLLTRRWPESYVAARLENIAVNKARTDTILARRHHEQAS